MKGNIKNIAVFGIGVSLVLVAALLKSTKEPEYTPPITMQDDTPSVSTTTEPTPSPASTTKPNNDSVSILTPPKKVTHGILKQQTPRKYTPTEMMAWIYPYEPACGAALEYRDGRAIDILKPEFFTINGGSLVLLDEATVPCNGYSPEFVTELKRYSKKQFATISSASAGDMESFLRNALVDGADITTLVDFVTKNAITGIELNFEDFGNWSPEQYADFKNFVALLGTKLHAHNKSLMVIGPPVANADEEAWYLWRYEDFATLPVDYMVVMGYDYQYDHGSGSPIAPIDWLSNIVAWISARYPIEKLTVGLPSYGYEGRLSTHQSSILTYAQIKSKPGFITAQRDAASGEMSWQQNGSVYFYQDGISLAKKRQALTNLGIRSFSIWHLGGNPWFE